MYTAFHFYTDLNLCTQLVIKPRELWNDEIYVITGVDVVLFIRYVLFEDN
jgi:hypothetical protein